MMRGLAIVAAGMLLSGCNLIVSQTPLFSAKDAQGQAQMRPGVWSDDGKTCDYDVAAPVDSWPACANGWVVQTDGHVLAPHKHGDPRASWTQFPYLIVKNDPPVMQVRMQVDQGAINPQIYIYTGMRILKSDTEGRVTAYKMWPVLCGPPPPPDPHAKGFPGLTHEPVKGVVVDEKQQVCTATTQAPVRFSAGPSEAWNGHDDNTSGHWVRDGDR
jgi:hypothetical protein